jgi:hypothetical protein
MVSHIRAKAHIEGISEREGRTHGRKKEKATGVWIKLRNAEHIVSNRKEWDK